MPLAAHPQTKQRFERVSRLVEGFESPFGLELLATVHWVATREDAETDEAVVAETYAWGRHKQQFSARQIHLAIRVLAEHGWIRRTVT
ncbi:MAG: hypothetical protein D6696_05895 [Acidobacteria bacterium]|nr:MAG: hypothetical protein D6696_05895 [Acidobacteriota bacterium]